MTSTASGFKFTRSLWRYLQGHWWLALLTALTMLLCGPVLTYFGLKNLWSGEAQMAIQQKEMLDFMTFGAFLPGLVVAMVLGVAFALIFSAYQHNKKEVDYRHSLPVRRDSWMLLYSLAGLLIFSVITLLMGLGSYAVGHAFVASFSLLTALGWILQTILFFATAYAVTLLAGQLTGNMVGHVGMATLLHFGFPVVAGTLLAWLSTELATFVKVGWLTTLEKWSLPTLFLYFANGSDAGASLRGQVFFSAPALVSLTLVALLAFGLSLVLYRRRPSERTGYTFIYPVTEYPVKGLVVLVGTLLAGLAFYQMTDKSLAALVIGVVLGGLILHIILTLLFHRDVHRIRRGLLSTGAFIAIALVFFLALHNDVTGFNSYRPADEDVQAVTISAERSPTLFIRNNRGEISLSDNLLPQGLTLGKNLQKGYFASVDTLEADKNKAIPSEWATVTWHLANGKTVVRQYEMLPKQLAEAYQPVYANLDYRKALYKDLFSNKFVRQIDGLFIDRDKPVLQADDSPMAGSSYAVKGLGGAPVSGQEILEALKADLLAGDRYLQKEAPNYQITLTLKEDAKFNQAYGQQTVTYPVYPEDKALMALIRRLTAAGALADPAKRLADTQVPGTLTITDEFTGETVTTVKDPQAIKALLENSVGDAFCYAGVPVDRQYSISGTHVNGLRYILSGHLPADLKAKAHN